ncbi:BTB/POZ domain-containing protein [Aphelenchoides avenae]|nr:BTB/POZ domain-containing protein [Aphelenchus avenae]
MSEKTHPVEKGTITLKLNDVSTYMTEMDQLSESTRQQVAGIEWCIRAYPQVLDNGTYLSCYLRGENASKWTAWVDATFRIVKNGGEFGNQYSFRKLLGNFTLGNNWGWPKFVTSEMLLSAANGLVVNNSVEIRADFSVTNVCGASFSVFETAGALAADIKLKVGDSVFYANKGYLSVVSPVFRDMFTLNDNAEGKKETEEIELKDLDASEFKEFLGVVYPTCYPITDTNVIRMFRIAVRFDVKRVIADCESHLFGANNVPWFDKLKLAVDLKRDRLKDHLISKMTCNDITAVNQNENKRQLGVEVLRTLLDKHIRICHP